MVLAVAFVLRLVAAHFLGAWQDVDGRTAWEWGYEQACVAQSLAEGRGFGDPWGAGSGPTAWLAPMYPALLGLLMAIFGGVSNATAAALITIQSAADAATCVLLAQLAIGLGFRRAARPAAYLWALYPLAVWNATHTVWDTSLVAFALTLFLSRLFAPGRVPGRPPGRGRAARLGLGYGALLLLNPAPVVLFPVVLWELGGGRLGMRAARGALSFGAAAGLVCLPWMIRNQVVVGTSGLRSNLGVELMIGNHDRSIGWSEAFKYNASHVETERDRYRALGEVAYSRECRERAGEWIAAHPGAFARLVLRRARLFWLSEAPNTDVRESAGRSAAGDPLSWIKYASFLAAALGGLAGLGLLRREGGREGALLMGMLLLFGLPYYLTHVSERYRFPVDPLLVLLSAQAAIAMASARAAGDRAGEERLHCRLRALRSPDDAGSRPGRRPAAAVAWAEWSTTSESHSAASRT